MKLIGNLGALCIDRATVAFERSKSRLSSSLVPRQKFLGVDALYGLVKNYGQDTSSKKIWGTFDWKQLVHVGINCMIRY